MIYAEAGENGFEDLLNLRKALFRSNERQVHEFVVGKAPEDHDHSFGLPGRGRPAGQLDREGRFPIHELFTSRSPDRSKIIIPSKQAVNKEIAGAFQFAAFPERAVKQPFFCNFL